MKFSFMVMTKQLQFHPKKSSFLLYGTDNYKAKIKLEAEQVPVKLGANVLLKKIQEKYLGDVFCCQGLSALVKQL